MKHQHSHRHPFRPQADLSHFYVITVISNPRMYDRRYELYWDFKEMVESAGVKLITVEQAFGHRPFMVTEPGNPFNVQIRSVEELWLKENMINIGGRRMMDIDPMAREVAWIDADCFPISTPIDWFESIWHELQRYEVVQCWEYMQEYTDTYAPIGNPQMSFMATYAAAGWRVPEGKTVKHTLAGHSGMIALGRPGLAWAANVDALNKVGWLLDRCILGSGDWHMAHGLVGAMKTWNGEFSKLNAYARYLLDWQDKALKWLDKDVGYVPGTVGHWFHGNKVDRHYGSRGSILIKNNYDPYRDVKPDAYGQLQLETYTEDQIKLRDEIRGYFAIRNEDHPYYKPRST